jgi:hypothetical protein
MKSLFTYILLIVLSLNAFTQNLGENIILNQPIVGGMHTYEATNSIQLLPGFSYTPQAAGNSFNALINPLLVLPPTAGETGGPGGSNSVVGDDGLVGGDRGSLTVDEYGNAVYYYPLEFPQGIGGMTPELSLVYRSGGKDGILGEGWSLGGLSVISHTPATIFHDSIHNAVNGGDFFEAYMLDGQRLVHISGNENDNHVYKKLEDDFSIISRVPRSSLKTTDNYAFKVETKGNLTYYYGETPESVLRFNAANTHYAIMYYISSIKDNYGNMIKFVYYKPTDNELYIDRIE